jgi:hypothetical protein
LLTLSSLAVFGAMLPALPQQRPSAQAVRADSPPAIDGVLDDAAWTRAHPLGDFVQFEPLRGDAASAGTQVRILFDSTAIYIGFRVLEPANLTAELTRRDANLLTDDAVLIVLDTYGDRQSGYMFGVNPLGTQADGRIANDGRTVDNAWDGEWQSAVRHTEDGWDVEIAIPLTSLRYASGEGRTWGLNVGRSRRNNLEVSFWSGPLENVFRVSGAGALTGLDLPAPIDRHQIISYGLTRLEQGSKTEWDVGGNVRYRITPSITADATVNPDFATIEADQAEVNPTRFEVSLPEKRPYFLEGAELYRQRIRTFYSRRIADIRGGAKMLGKGGAWTWALMGVETEPADSAPSAAFGVARLQRDLGRSSVGGMWAGRHASGNGEGSISLDATLFFSSAFGMTAQAVQSYGSAETGTAAFFVRPSYDSPTGHFHVRYSHVGENFQRNVNRVGFVRDDDRREVDSAIEKTVWFGSGAFERLTYDSNYNIYWGQAGTLRSWKIDEAVAVDLRSKWSARLSHSEEFKLFEKDFRNRDSGLRIGYNTRAFQSVSASYRTGHNFDADFDLFAASARFKPTDSSALEYELQRLVLDPDPDGETTWIHVVRGNHYFTPDLYLQLFYQSNTRIDRNNIQAVFVYRYLPPFGSLQVAFQRGTAAFGQASEQGNTLFVKLSTVF